MIGYYNYSVILTYIGLCIGIFGIVFAASGDTHGALICLMSCGLCDMFDGTIARTCKNRSEDAKTFGIQIDSLCDLVCFGVLPAAIGYSIGVNSILGILAMGLFVLAALIRLGYFNVQEMNRVRDQSGRRTSYLGLPVTSAAVIIPAYLLASMWIPFSILPFYPLFLFLVGVAFVTKFKVSKPYKKGMVILLVLGLLEYILVIVYGTGI